MKHIVDIETWERKDNYNFFRGFANSWIAITSIIFMPYCALPTR